MLYVHEIYFDTIMHAGKERTINDYLYCVQDDQVGYLNDWRMSKYLNMDILEYRRYLSKGLAIEDIHDKKYKDNPPMYGYNQCTMILDRGKCENIVSLLNARINIMEGII